MESPKTPRYDLLPLFSGIGLSRPVLLFDDPDPDNPAPGGKQPTMEEIEKNITNLLKKHGDDSRLVIKELMAQTAEHRETIRTLKAETQKLAQSSVPEGGMALDKEQAEAWKKYLALGPIADLEAARDFLPKGKEAVDKLKGLELDKTLDFAVTDLDTRGNRVAVFHKDALRSELPEDAVIELKGEGQNQTAVIKLGDKEQTVDAFVSELEKAKPWIKFRLEQPFYTGKGGSDGGAEPKAQILQVAGSAFGAKKGKK